MITKDFAPICLFTYNRLEETKKTVQALKRNFLAGYSKIYIFSDGPKDAFDLKKIKKVRKYLYSIKGFKNTEIIESKKNMGLKKSIIRGVSTKLKSNNKIIVLEDDLITSTNFLEFMNKALNFYEMHEDILSISGYSFPLLSAFTLKYVDVYKYPRFFSWGWGTWKNRWEQINWDSNFYQKKISTDKKFKNKLNKGGQDQVRMLNNTINGTLSSWAIIYSSNLALNKGYTIVPKISKILNVGFSDEATHTKFSDRLLYQTKIDNSNQKNFNFINKINYVINFEIWFIRYSNLVRAILYIFNKF